MNSPPDAYPADEFINLVGQITIAWSNLQFYVLIIFKELLGNQMPVAEAIFFSLRSDKGQRDITQALIDVTITDNEDLRKSAKAKINKISDLASSRNRVIHAMWFTGHEEAMVSYWPASAKQYHGKNVIKELRDDLTKFQDLSDDLYELCREIDYYSKHVRRDQKWIEQIAEALLLQSPPQPNEGEDTHLDGLLSLGGTVPPSQA